MSVQIPTSEPSVITAGETWAWTKSLSDFPATDGYVLKYALQAVGKPLITLTATTSGAGYAVNVLAATTAGYAPAVYTWQSYLELGAARYPGERGSLSVLASPLAAYGSTHSTRTLALIELALEQRIPNGLEMTNVDGQELHLIGLEALTRLQRLYQAKVQAEANALRVANGLKSRRFVYTRFTSPQ